MFPTRLCASNGWTMHDIVQRLQESGMVDGVALFGSGYDPADPASDYDVLILVNDPPVHIFQMQTYIDGVLCDVTFVDTAVTERTLLLQKPVAATSAEGFLIGWLEWAQIEFDRNGLLGRLQAKLRSQDWRTSALNDAERYGEWFWLNFDLRLMKRLILSDDPVRLMTLDLRLMNCVSNLCRSYFRLRGWHWSGEKAALRVLQARDAEFFNLMAQFLTEIQRPQRLALCERLIARTLDHPQALWADGASAVWLKDSSEQPQRVGEGLQLWEELIGEKT